MLGLDDVYVDDIATALADHTDDDHCLLTKPDTGEVVFWTSDIPLVPPIACCGAVDVSVWYDQYSSLD
ncbi:MAG: hypothetical protein WCA30_13160, partial [Dermatophilaceae bacterium]